MANILWMGTTILEKTSQRIAKLLNIFGMLNVSFPNSTDGFWEFDKSTVQILKDFQINVIATDTDVTRSWISFFSDPTLRNVKIYKWDSKHEVWEEITYEKFIKTIN